MKMSLWGVLVLASVVLSAPALAWNIHGQVHQIAGVIEWVNGTPPYSFVVMEPTRWGETYFTFRVDDYTQFVLAPNGWAADPGYLVEGQPVVVRYEHLYGQDWADGVAFLPPPPDDSDQSN